MYNISFKNIHVERSGFPFYLEASIVAADVGKAVAQDTSAAHTVKLAGDDDVIIGFLDTVEDRSIQEGVKVGSVQQLGGFAFKYTGTAPSIGHGIVGSATAGVVKGTGAAAAAGQPRVWHVDTTKSEVQVTIW